MVMDFEDRAIPDFKNHGSRRSTKLLGRRKAGTWGRAAKKVGKRTANKATRRKSYGSI
jgi:hypothetical protein